MTGADQDAATPAITQDGHRPASYLDKAPDSARMGKAAEYLVAASAILATRGELNVSTALVDDDGVDLVFHRRGQTATLAVQVKSRMSDAKLVGEGRVQANVQEATFRRDRIWTSCSWSSTRPRAGSRWPGWCPARSSQPSCRRPPVNLIEILARAAARWRWTSSGSQGPRMSAVRE